MFHDTATMTTTTATGNTPPAAPSLSPQLRELIAAVCARIPPLWDLENYVAVNPFLGFAHQPVPHAARIINDGLGAQVLPQLAYYRQQWQSGRLARADLTQAAARHGADAQQLIAILDGTAPMPTRPAQPVLLLTEQRDLHDGTQLAALWRTHVTQWCAVHIPTDGRTPWGGTAQASLYTAWRTTAHADRMLAIAGVRDWRGWVQQLPSDPDTTIARMLAQAAVAPAQHEAYLYRLLGGVFGWASFLRRATWQQAGATGMLADLLAIGISTDVALATRTARPAVPRPAQLAPVQIEDEQIRLILQDALEDSYLRHAVPEFAPPPAAAAPRPVVQAFFCIDVRSELIRRHLEAVAPAVTTHGFAGFFGVSVDWHADGHGSARCPVLLQPSVQIRSQGQPRNTNQKLLQEVLKAPGTGFTFVETLGLSYGLGLLGDALRWTQAARPDEGTAPFTLEPTATGQGIALADRIAAGGAILKNMGLRETFGRIVLLCGHGSTSENNPHAAGLDCGACGGHGGAINARIAAAILNDPAVRQGLAAQGWNIPSDTVFVPALHDTTCDTVTLYDLASVPASHQPDLRQLQQWLDQAGAGVRRERAASLGLGDQPRQSRDRLIQHKARDWSEVRPEWALARNAAFIAARRERTRTLNLAGRSFLHDYDWRTDPDLSILGLILNAPMVVASWINLQYFASTVDNEQFGCGTKALHNRIGAVGVVLGNGGDLRTGLALQSVQAADGRWYHEPLRLQVVVEAPTAKIDTVLAASPAVLDLIGNGWVRLFALDPESTTLLRWQRDGWQAR